MPIDTEQRPEPAAPNRVPPTRLAGTVFAGKMTVLRVRRGWIDLSSGPPRHRRGAPEATQGLLAETRTPLWTSRDPAEHSFQLGKIQNLRLACRALDGLHIPAGAVFSFWRQVGPPLALRGFVRGRMLQEGCMVGAIGGGLCQLSNALYDCALQADCEILERHAHSRIVPGSAAARGRDATVAWNYVDLRFSAARDLRMTARVAQDQLVVRLYGAQAERQLSPPPVSPDSAGQAPHGPRSCATCDETDCHLHQRERRTRSADAPVHAFLVDEAWPEFAAYVEAIRGPNDRLGRPIDGARLGLRRYAWPGAGFERVQSAPMAAISRTLALRSAGASAVRLRRAELAGAERLAQALASLLAYDVTGVTVAQSYLPYLWRDGLLGARDLSVLMTRLPLAEMQTRLDAAAARHPNRRTLSEFRAPAWLVEAEADALAACARIITPHTEVAAYFGDRAVRLPWSSPLLPSRAQGDLTGRILFPGPTVGRKGADQVREAALALDLEVFAVGSPLEGEDFWRPARTVRLTDWRQVDAVVQPAVIEHQPRGLLAALAIGLPVIATPACGLAPQPGLTLVPPGDTAALIAALSDVLAGARQG